MNSSDGKLGYAGRSGESSSHGSGGGSYGGANKPIDTQTGAGLKKQGGGALQPLYGATTMPTGQGMVAGSLFQHPVDQYANQIGPVHGNAYGTPPHHGKGLGLLTGCT